MRAVKSVLSTAGQLKRSHPEINEEMLIFQAIKEANLPKFVDNDIEIFLSILGDLFPNLRLEDKIDQRIYDSVVSVLRNKKFLTLEPFIKKIF
jgi:dynein heavy chain